MLTGSMIRTLLIVDMVGMALLALCYLRQRRMSTASYLCWGLVALTIPLLGPFLLIVNRPGIADPAASVIQDVRRLASAVHVWISRGVPKTRQLAPMNRFRQWAQKLKQERADKE